MKALVYIFNIKNINEEIIDLLKVKFPNRFNQIIKCKDTNDQKRSLAATYLFFKNNNNVSENDILYGNYGKPLLKSKYFSMSHSENLAVYVEDSNEIGIDVMHIKNRNLFTIKSRLHNDEQRHIEENRLSNFYKIWSQKESVVKLTGDGLSVPLNSFNVVPFSQGKPIIFQNKTIYNYTIKYLDYYISVSSLNKIDSLTIEIVK